MEAPGPGERAVCSLGVCMCGGGDLWRPRILAACGSPPGSALERGSELKRINGVGYRTCGYDRISPISL